MPIEFRCTGCQKLLRVADESAGKKAKCPECSMVLDVPSASTAAAASPAPRAEPPAFSPRQPPPFEPQPSSPASDNPYQAPMTDSALPGGPFREDAEPGEIVPTIIDVGDVLSRSWELYKSQMGIVIGAFFITNIIPNFVLQILMPALAQVHEIAPLFGLLVFIVVTAYLGAGHLLFLLDIGRGKQGDLSRLFQGGPQTLSLILLGLLLTIVCGLGLVLLVVPGVILMLMFAFAPAILIERNTGVGDAMSVSNSITSGNKGTLFLLYLVTIGITLLGYLACCVGIFVAAPFINVIYVVAYLMASGQKTG